MSYIYDIVSDNYIKSNTCNVTRYICNPMSNTYNVTSSIYNVMSDVCNIMSYICNTTRYICNIMNDICNVSAIFVTSFQENYFICDLADKKGPYVLITISGRHMIFFFMFWAISTVNGTILLIKTHFSYFGAT